MESSCSLTMTVMQDEQEAILCQSCGMCCRGAFFVNIKISEDEMTLLTQATRLKPFSRKNKFYSPQPCPELSSNACLIYDRRPKDCKNYECKLLDSLKSRTKSLDECLSDVQLLQTKYDQLCHILLNQDSAPSIDVFNLRYELARFITAHLDDIQSDSAIYSLPSHEVLVLVCDYLKVVNDNFRRTKLLPKMNKLITLVRARYSRQM